METVATDTDAEKEPSLYERVTEIEDRLVELCRLQPGQAADFAFVLRKVNELRKFANEAEAAETATCIAASGFEVLIDAIESMNEGGGEKPGGSSTPEIRALLADLLELAPDDDHGVYPSGTIDRLRECAR
jgi:hypothetical protein